MIRIRSVGWMVVCGLLLLAQFIPGVSHPVSAQPPPDRPDRLPGDRVPDDRVRDERLRSDRVAAEQGRRSDRPAEWSDHYPGEFYVAGYGGFTIGHEFDDATGVGTNFGLNFPSHDLANSGVFGGKIGYFFPGRMDWLGVEAEAFRSTPHLRQTGALTGGRLEVTTVAINLIARTWLACGPRPERLRDRDTTDPNAPRRSAPGYHEHGFCALQPYAGVGLGAFFAEATTGAARSYDSTPGLNALAGLRYFLTDHVALFGEYKFNYAAFKFEDYAGPGAGLKGNYSVSHIVGGLSYHF